MSRRGIIPKRVILPDPKYKNQTIAKFINHVMVNGKKAVAEKIVYGALAIVEDRQELDPVELFEKALEEVAPITEVKSRRIGGSTLPIPTEVRPSRRTALAMRWLVDSARSRGEKTMAARLAGELMDAVNGRGGAVRKRTDVHRQAEANRAFAHYRF